MAPRQQEKHCRGLRSLLLPPRLNDPRPPRATPLCAAAQVNKPYLPLASGAMTLEQGRWVVRLTAALGAAIGELHTRPSCEAEPLPACPASVTVQPCLAPSATPSTVHSLLRTAADGSARGTPVASLSLAGLLSGSPPLLATLLLSLALGVAYSADLPWLRWWARDPVAHNMCPPRKLKR